MGGPFQFPDDENGAVLRRMQDRGDNLAAPRIIDFHFVFLERKQAIAFVELVDERDLEICVSYYAERQMWEATVKRYMIPSYQDISVFESDLAVRAERVGGEPDGWGCMMIKQ